jgi:hypothetical protein
VAALKKEKKPFFVAKLQEEIDSDGIHIPAAVDASTVTTVTAATATTSRLDFCTYYL